MGLMNNSQYVMKVQKLKPDNSKDAGKQTAHLRFMHPVNGIEGRHKVFTENVSELTIVDGHLKNESYSLAQLAACTAIHT